MPTSTSPRCQLPASAAPRACWRAIAGRSRQRNEKRHSEGREAKGTAITGRFAAGFDAGLAPEVGSHPMAPFARRCNSLTRRQEIIPPVVGGSGYPFPGQRVSWRCVSMRYWYEYVASTYRGKCQN